IGSRTISLTADPKNPTSTTAAIPSAARPLAARARRCLESNRRSTELSMLTTEVTETPTAVAASTAQIGSDAGEKVGRTVTTTIASHRPIKPTKTAVTSARIRIGRNLADQIEIGEAREHRLAPDSWILEGDRDLLVAPGQLGGDDDPIPPAPVAHTIAVPILALAGDDRARRADGARCRRAARPCERTRWRALVVGLALGTQVAGRAERLAGRRSAGRAAPLAIGGPSTTSE